MNKEELKAILTQYGISRIGNSRYYTDLAEVFYKSYRKVFTQERILNLGENGSSILASRLPMEGLFKDNEIKDLTFHDNYIFDLNGHPFFEMNSKKQVKRVWVNGKAQLLTSLIYVEEYLNSINEKDKMFIMEELSEYQEQQIFLSFFYKYVLALLEDSAKTDIDNVRIGCFKNSYFDILNYKTINLDSSRSI